MFTPHDYPFSRDGIAGECSPDEETVMIHDLDIELLRRHRYRGTTTNLSDRRLDLYTVRYKDGEETKEL